MPGVYISYPFCAQKCTYCNFASGVFPRELEARYVDTLRAELQAAAWPWTPQTVYLGGGTPSLLAPAALAAIMNLVPGRPWREATMEAAPGGLTAGVVEAWREAGINRVSLGVQSFVQKELARTGRRHTALVVEREIGMLRAAGIESINVDLIAGLPGQTEASFRESLDWIERLEAPHVSVYMLEVDEDSRLGRELLRSAKGAARTARPVRSTTAPNEVYPLRVLREIPQSGMRYGAADVPSDDAIAHFYELAVERLRRCGIERYEISNFARPGLESRHNLKYWKREPYLGFGADAHSFDGESRWSNPETAAAYVAHELAPGRTAADALAEKYFLGLRLREGVECDAFENTIDRFVLDGLLERAGSRVRLTPRGVLLSNEVFAGFIGADLPASK